MMFHPKGPTFWELAVQALSSTQRGYDLLAPKFEYTPFRTPQPLLDAAGMHLQSLGPFDAGLDICCGTGAAMAMLRPHCRERVVGIDFSQGMLDVARKLTAPPHPSPPPPGGREKDIPHPSPPPPGGREKQDTPSPTRGEGWGGGAARLEFVRGDVLAMPFTAEFDLAVSFGAFGHILEQDEPRFVSEIARVLKPGGRFVFITTYMPSLTSPHYWMSRLFNGAMRVRNFLIKPPFIMYYLTFLLPEVEKLLRRHGFAVEVRDMGFKGFWSAARLVIATRGANG